VPSGTVASVVLTRSLRDPDGLSGRWLTASERRRAAAYADPDDRRDYLAAHFLVRAVAARLLAADPGELTLGSRRARCGGQAGRPVIEDHPRLHVSLAHTGGAVIAAASAGPVGVDIESLRRPRFDLALLEEALTGSELLAISQSADPHAAVLRHWARKEALVKTGAGALDRLRDLDLAHLSISGGHDLAPVRSGLGAAWPQFSLLDRVDSVSGIAYAVIAREPVLLSAVCGSPAAAATGG
jgi:4'-phosphopantetheinyl transferase